MAEDRASKINRIILRLHEEGHEPPYLFGQMSATTGEMSFRRVAVKDGDVFCPDGGDALEVPTIVILVGQNRWLKVEFRYPSGLPEFSQS